MEPSLLFVPFLIICACPQIVEMKDALCPDALCPSQSCCRIVWMNDPRSRQCQPCARCGNDNSGGYEIKPCSDFHNALCCPDPTATAVYDEGNDKYICGLEMLSDDGDTCSCPPGYFCELTFAPAKSVLCLPCFNCDDSTTVEVHEAMPCGGFYDTLCCSKSDMKPVYDSYKKKYFCDDDEGEGENGQYKCNENSCPLGHFCKKAKDSEENRCEQCSQCSENEVDVYEILACGGFRDSLCCPFRDMMASNSIDNEYNVSCVEKKEGNDYEPNDNNDRNSDQGEGSNKSLWMIWISAGIVIIHA